jgi:hypothetical protein
MSDDRYRVLAGSQATIGAIQRLALPGRNLVPDSPAPVSMESDAEASSENAPRPATITDGSGVRYSVTYTDSTGGSGTAMPLQLNFFYQAPSGTAIVVIPLEQSLSGDGSGV